MVQVIDVSENELHTLLKDFLPVFENIDKHARLMQEGIYQDGTECKKALIELTGLYMRLKPYCTLLEAEKLNKELITFNTLRINTENTPDKKFVAISAEKEAGASAADLRRVRNIFQGYSDACQVAISSCQSVLKFLGEEIKLGSQQT